MGGYGGGGYPTMRPPAANWAQQQEYDAQDAWERQGQSVAGDVASARAARDKATGAADASMASFGALGDPNVTGWSPSYTKSATPNSVAQWMTSLNNLRAQTGPTAFQSAVQPGGPTSSASGAALKGYSAADVSGFDPTKFGQTFAQGAVGEFNTNLTDRLATLENQAVGAGRLRTGFYDRDQGNVTTRLGQDFNQKIAQEAGVFSGQKLDALKAAAGLRLSQAQGIDAGTQADLERQLRAGEDINSATLAARGQDIGYGENLNAFGLEKGRMGLQGSQFMDTQAADRARFLDTTGLDRAKFLDTSATGRATTGLEAALNRERGFMGDYNTQASRGDEFASASRDWAASDRAAQDTRDAIARAQGRLPFGQKGTAFGGGFSSRGGPQDVNRQVAMQFGVPYFG